MKRLSAGELLEEELIELVWMKMRQFTHEVICEFDIEGRLPIDQVMFSLNVKHKWDDWARLN